MTKFWKDLCIPDFIAFQKKKETIFSLQFGFKQKYSTAHILIHLTDKIRDETNKGNYACGIFLDFQKAFHTVDHHILLKKLEHYGVSINAYNSNLADIKYGVPQGSILGPLLFPIYINNLKVAMTYSEVHHFADDTNILNFNSFVKSMNKQVNYDLKKRSKLVKGKQNFPKCW